MDRLQLQVLLGMVDKITKPLRTVMGGTNDVSKALKSAKDQLKQLNDAQSRVDAWRKTAKELGIFRNTLKGAQDRVKQYKAEIAKLPAPTKDLSRALKEAKEEASKAKEMITKLSSKQQRLRDEFKAAGQDTRTLAAYQRDLTTRIDQTRAAVDRETAAMKRQNEVAHKLYAAKADYAKLMAKHATLMHAGQMTLGVGLAGAAPVALAIKQYASLEDAMLGVAKQVGDARDGAGNLTRTYYELREQIMALSERIPMAAQEIAAIVEAGARMGIQGKRDLMAYAETAAIAATAFGLPVDQVGDDMAKIAQLYHVPITRIRELGDTINWLDDQSLATGGAIMDVMKRIGGTAAFLKMPYREAGALASTLLSLGSSAEVAGTASNAMMTNLAAATMMPKRFQEGVAMLHLSSEALQKAMSKNPTQTILQVIDAINKLPETQRLEATTRLFGKEFGDDVAKLAANVGEYRKQLEMVANQRAVGSMQREMDARNKSQTASWEEAKNAAANLAAMLGETLAPAVKYIADKAKEMLSGFRAWVQENPGLAGALAKTAAVGTLLVAGIGALIIVVGALIAPLALARLAFSVLGIRGLASLLMLDRGAAIARAGMESIHVATGLAGRGVTAMGTQIRAATLATRGALAAQWVAAAPGAAWTATRGYATTLATRLPMAAKAAAAATGQFVGSLGTNILQRSIMGLVLMTAATRHYAMATWHAVTARIALARTAIATKGGLNLIKAGSLGALKGLWAGLLKIGQIILFVGRIALLSPIGLLITALTAGALLIIKYWQPIQAFFSGMWAGFKEGLAPIGEAFSGIREAIKPLQPIFDWLGGAIKSVVDWFTNLFTPIKASQESLDSATQSGHGFGKWLAGLIVLGAKLLAWFIELPIKFVTVGAQIADGIWSGLKTGWGKIITGIKSLAGLLPEGVRKVLGIKSPSRVFAAIGGHTMDGLREGLQRGHAGPLEAVQDIAKRLTAAGAGIMLSAGVQAMPNLATQPLRIDTRPPLTQAQGAADQGGGIHIGGIHIHAAPGQSPQDIAAEVEKAILRIEQRRAARARRQLTDRD